jgi:hypothetical protein
MGIAGGSCQRILTQGLNMQWIAAKCLLNLLADKQKYTCITVCEDVHENFRGPTCPSKVIIDNSTQFDNEKHVTVAGCRSQIQNTKLLSVLLTLVLLLDFVQCYGATAS